MLADNQVHARRSVCAGDSQFRFSQGLSVFFPAYNDAPSLPSLIDRTFETLQRVAADFEVIVVNDGSTDETAKVLEELRQRYSPLLRVVTHDRNLGYGAALRSGFAAATKEYIFYTDGDGQYDPAELEKLLRAATPNAGLVNGYKLERSDPWHRIMIGSLYNSFARWLFRIAVRDIDCDFRLIRRSALDPASLRSTGGTICIELVRAMELSGSEVLEVPVHHYPRAYGRSQFFRVRSLAVTFLQLCNIFLQLVVAPVFSTVGQRNQEPAAGRSGMPSWRWMSAVGLSVVVLSVLAYAPALQLPLIGDDYLQIQLAREYAPVSHWGALARDTLYRSRATSLIFTYWLERVAGLAPLYYNAASLLLHIIDSLLIFALGCWRPVGWRVAALAACFFAVSQRHSEAVVWFAAVPELLVFFFVLAAFLFWIGWLENRSYPKLLCAAAFACYLLALVSKESGVAAVPLFAVAVLCQPQHVLKKLWGLAPFAAVAVIYFSAIYGASARNPHFSDGTFSLEAPFLQTLLRSLGGLLWLWGIVSLPLLFTEIGRRRRGLMIVASAWMVLTLAPYCFLTYMPRVPSRHTYMASVGVSFVVAIALLVLADYAFRWKKMWLVPAAMAVIVTHQCAYQWTIKYRQYFQRALPTEQLIYAAASRGREIHAKCFPYSPVIANLALELRLGENSHPLFQIGAVAAHQPDAIDFCNADADGTHY